MSFYNYITPSGQEALKSYKYSGQDKSLIYKYILSPWAQFCVDKFTPWTVAPNTITLVGLMCQVVALCLAYTLAPQFQVPTTFSGSTTTNWPMLSATLAALSVFIYSTLDNMDGKHARRTGSSSPLGLLFDHGCDAINAGLVGWCLFGLQTGSGTNTWTTFVLWLTPTMPFFFNTWEEFHIGELILPIFNGPNEGLLTCVTFMLMTAYFGAELWQRTHTTVPLLAWGLTPIADAMRWGANKASVYAPQTATATGAGAGDATVEGTVTYLSTWLRNAEGSITNPLTNLEVLLAATMAAGVITVATQTANVCQFEYKRGSWPAVRAALIRQVSILSLFVTMALWLHTPACASVVGDHWVLFYGAAGVLFVDATCKLMVSHVTVQEYTPSYLGTGLFAVAPVFLKVSAAAAAAGGGGGEGGGGSSKLLFFPAKVTGESFASLMLLVTFAFAFLSTSAFLLSAVQVITSTLNIDVFSIERQLKANAAKKNDTTSTKVKTTITTATSKAVVNGTASPSRAASPASSTASTKKKRAGSASPARSRR